MHCPSKRLYNTTAKARKAYHRINLKGENQKDLLWWREMLPAIPKRDILTDRQDISSYDMHLYTDASKTHGAAIYGTHWGMIRFEGEEAKEDISSREFSMIIRAVATWGHLWSGLRIIFHCDNMGVVTGAKSCYVKSEALMRHYRSLQFLTTVMDFEFHIVHIPGKTNELADLLSRNRLHVAQAKGYWLDSFETKLAKLPHHSFA